MNRDRALKALDKYRNHPEFLGLNLIEVNQRGATDDCVIHIAARSGTPAEVEELIKCGADVNIPGDLGNTPLHMAAMAGNRDAIKILLQYGANREVKNEFEQKPKDVAALAGHADLAKKL